MVLEFVEFCLLSLNEVLLIMPSSLRFCWVLKLLDLLLLTLKLVLLDNTSLSSLAERTGESKGTELTLTGVEGEPIHDWDCTTLFFNTVLSDKLSISLTLLPL